MTPAINELPVGYEFPPVTCGDSVTIKMTLKEKLPDGPATRINLDISCYNHKGELVTVAAGSGLSR